MIRIRTPRPPAPTPENIKQFTGRTLNIERAIAILQLPGNENGSYFSAAMVAASAWEKGSAEYSKALRGFHYLATRYLKETGSGGKKRAKAWTADQWRATLTLEMHEKGCAIINAVCDRNDAKLADGSQVEVLYLFSGETNEIYEKVDQPKNHEVDISFVALEEEKESSLMEKVLRALRLLSLPSRRVVRLSISTLAVLVITLMIIGVAYRSPRDLNSTLTFSEFINESSVLPQAQYPKIENHSSRLGWNATFRASGPGGIFALMNGPSSP